MSSDPAAPACGLPALSAISRRTSAWWLIVGGVAAALLLGTVVAAAARLVFWQWPGEGEQSPSDGTLPSSTFWRARAAELIVVVVIAVVGVALLVIARRRLGSGAAHVGFAVTVGMLAGLPLAAGGTAVADRVVTSHLEDAWLNAPATAWADLPKPPPPTPQLAHLLWKPDASGLSKAPALPAHDSTPTTCESHRGATAAARQGGDNGQLIILERITQFPSAAQAERYPNDAARCGTPSGYRRVSFPMPKVPGADTQIIEAVTRTPSAQPPATGRTRVYVRMRLRAFVLTAVMGSLDETAAGPTRMQVHLASRMLTKAAATVQDKTAGSAGLRRVR